MQRIINAIEEKLKDNELTIFVKDSEIKELKRKLEEAEKTIESQAQIISSQEKTIEDLKGIDR